VAWYTEHSLQSRVGADVNQVTLSPMG